LEQSRWVGLLIQLVASPCRVNIDDLALADHPTLLGVGLEAILSALGPSELGGLVRLSLDARFDLAHRHGSGSGGRSLSGSSGLGLVQAGVHCLGAIGASDVPLRSLATRTHPLDDDLAYGRVHLVVARLHTHGLNLRRCLYS